MTGRNIGDDGRLQEISLAGVCRGPATGDDASIFLADLDVIEDRLHGAFVDHGSHVGVFRGVDAILVRAMFSRNGRGWTFGEAGSIYTTHDSGNTWVPLRSPTRHLLLGGIFVDDDRGWLVGAGGTIIQTSDGGETWYQPTLPQVEKSTRFTATSFVDNRKGWAVGSGGSVYSTVNGGRTWQRQESTVDTDLFDVKFVDALEGWAVGAEGTIIHTTDGGQRWTTERSGTPHPLERVFFSDRNHGWAVGFGGTVVSYLRNGASATRQ